MESDSMADAIEKTCRSYPFVPAVLGYGTTLIKRRAAILMAVADCLKWRITVAGVGCEHEARNALAQVANEPLVAPTRLGRRDMRLLRLWIAPEGDPDRGLCWPCMQQETERQHREQQMDAERRAWENEQMEQHYREHPHG